MVLAARRHRAAKCRHGAVRAGHLQQLDKRAIAAIGLAHARKLAGCGSIVRRDEAPGRVLGLRALLAKRRLSFELTFALDFRDTSSIGSSIAFHAPSASSSSRQFAATSPMRATGDGRWSAAEKYVRTSRCCRAGSRTMPRTVSPANAISRCAMASMSMPMRAVGAVPASIDEQPVRPPASVRLLADQPVRQSSAVARRANSGKARRLPVVELKLPITAPIRLCQVRRDAARQARPLFFVVDDNRTCATVAATVRTMATSAPCSSCQVAAGRSAPTRISHRHRGQAGYEWLQPRLRRCNHARRQAGSRAASSVCIDCSARAKMALSSVGTTAPTVIERLRPTPARPRPARNRRAAFRLTSGRRIHQFGLGDGARDRGWRDAGVACNVRSLIRRLKAMDAR